MKEILYIQAGEPANYIGTHFWNTQESYFTYGDEGDSEICHGISFREGLNEKGEPTFCPRLLAFDHKSKFGTLSQANALFGMDDTGNEDFLWPADPIEFKQDPIRKSHYQIDMAKTDGDEQDTLSDVQLEDVRYWSDFNRLFYVPRTVQKLPDIPEWEDAEGSWTAGQQTFTRFDEDTGLMEGPVRLFLEECETIQGIQLIHDTSTFGSFINSFLTSVRDDLGKLPLLAWPLLSNAAPVNIVDNGRGTRKVINDALVLRGLSELSSLSIPIQSPTTWTDEVCRNTYIHASRAHAYHTSAVLSAHIETSTLPLRLNAAEDDIQSLAGQFNWRTVSPFTELSGAFPHGEIAQGIHNFSASGSGFPLPTEFGRRDVTRGFSSKEITAYNEWLRQSGIDESLVSSIHAAAYPLPTSFPSFFTAAETSLQPRGAPGILSRPRSVSVFSSIGASSGTAGLFSGYARFVETCARRKIAVEHMGVDADEMGDLANDLWTLHDNAGGEIDPGEDTDVRGEDEA